jgi:hypothetical protein
MSPGKKGSVPEAQAQRIFDGLAARAEAQLTMEQAVSDALKAGGSVREVAALSGLSGTTGQKYGHACGWPLT